MSAESIVDEFIAAICEKDLDGAVALCDPAIIYDNVPLGPVEGHEGVRTILEPFLGMAEQVDWVVHRQVAAGDVVMNERTDRFHMADGWLELPVAGIFEVGGGRITLWRDFFDLASLQAQMSQISD